jgi:phosphate-selective porin OprO/OprP
LGFLFRIAMYRNHLFGVVGSFLLSIILLPAISVGQHQEVDERSLIEVKDGISISKDSLFLLNLRFRMQSRMGFITEGGDDLDIALVDARVRRLRLRFDGYVLNRNFRYYLQLSFARADMDLESGSPQPVRDAMVYYHLNKRFYLGFGQSKLPGNRERVISSGNLQFPDRSIANAAYTLDRDFGLFAYWSLPAGAQEVQVKGAFTTGDGRGISPSDAGMCYTGRLEWLPLGKFTNSGDYSEGDLEFEPRPKLSIAGTYSYNESAFRTGGQLGPLLYASRDITTVIADMMFKHKGWGVMAEYFDRRNDDPVTVSDEGDIRFVQVGTGFNVQASRLFRSKYELATRYTQVVPDASLGTLAKTTEELLLGSTKYLNGHRIKLQIYAGYRWQQRQMALDAAGSSWTAMFQVEFGI